MKKIILSLLLLSATSLHAEKEGGVVHSVKSFFGWIVEKTKNGINHVTSCFSCKKSAPQSEEEIKKQVRENLVEDQIDGEPNDN